jgi:hypothetical protein
MCALCLQDCVLQASKLVCTEPLVIKVKRPYKRRKQLGTVDSQSETKAAKRAKNSDAGINDGSASPGGGTVYYCPCGRTFGKAAWRGNHQKACQAAKIAEGTAKDG